jgi:Skp family chaperone for outer membrane proteins
MCRAGSDVAVVNMSRVIRAYPDTESAETVLKGQVEEFEAEQKELVSRGEKLREEFDEIREQAENKALSESARDKKIEQAREKAEDLRQFERDAREKVRLRQRQLADQELRLRRRIVDKLRGVVQEYAADKGLSLVLDTSRDPKGIDTVVFSSEALDITEDIIKLSGGKESAESPEKED